MQKQDSFWVLDANLWALLYKPDPASNHMFPPSSLLFWCHPSRIITIASLALMLHRDPYNFLFMQQPERTQKRPLLSTGFPSHSGQNVTDRHLLKSPYDLELGYLVDSPPIIPCCPSALSPLASLLSRSTAATILPQSLCTCGSLCLSALFPHTYRTFRSLLRSYNIRENLLCHSIQNSTEPYSVTLLYPSPNTYHGSQVTYVCMFGFYFHPLECKLLLMHT